MSAIQTHYRNCNICEAMCGLEIQYQDKEIISIKGDKKDPFSKGHICPKAIALQDFYHDPDRLKKPVKKTADGWVEISWEEAFDEVTTRIKAIQEKHGKNAVGTYLGNPNVHKAGNSLMLPNFIRALKSRNRYSASSIDQLPHHFVSHYMLGHGSLLPVPDIDHTEFLLIIGGNPMISNGSMMTCPDFAHRMKAIKERGGQVVVIDPRRTETAKKATKHHFIKPERDALLLLAMIHVIFKENLDNLKHLADHVNGLDEVKSIAQAYSPEVVAPSVGIAAEDIRQLALDFAKAEKACCYSRMGACTQSFGGLNLWLTYVLNIISGNFDQEGGYMFTQPAFDIVKLNSRKNRPDSYKKYTSRVWEFPYYNGEFPVATLADEILTSGEGQIKAMVSVAGNPVVTTPNADQLDKAFESLEFYVAVDIYINATTRHADIILPGCTALEIAQYDVSFHNLAVRNTVKYSPPLFEKEDYQKDDWEILQELTARLSDKPIQRMTPEMMLEYGFMSGPHKDKGINLQKLLENPHGIDLGPLQTCLLDRIETSDEKISLAPEAMLEDLPRLKKAMQEDQQTSFSHRLIGRRLLRSHNSWTQNSYRLVKGRNECTLLLHPEDAQAKGIENGDRVEVISAVGKVQIEVEVSDEIMPGVVSIPQGWGQAGKGIRLSVAEGKSGVNMNKLTDHRRIDQLTGNAAVNGVPVNILVTE